MSKKMVAVVVLLWFLSIVGSVTITHKLTAKVISKECMSFIHETDVRCGEAINKVLTTACPQLREELLDQYKKREN